MVEFGDLADEEGRMRNRVSEGVRLLFSRHSGGFTGAVDLRLDCGVVCNE